MAWIKLPPWEYIENFAWKVLPRGEGAPNPFELGILENIYEMYTPKVTFDIGTGRGTTARLFANGLDTEVITIGICQDDIPSLQYFVPADEIDFIPTMSEWCRIVRMLSKEGVRVIWADSFKFNFRALPQFDFVFVDGCHSYEYVKNDTEKAFTKLKPGGVIIWHDYQDAERSLWPGVRDYLDEQAEKLDLIHLWPTSLVIMEKRV